MAARESDDDRLAQLVGSLGGSPGLCADCVHRRLISSARSVFLRCALADADPRFSRYPPLPVLECAGHKPATLKRP